jgi:hypothetical protein
LKPPPQIYLPDFNDACKALLINLTISPADLVLSSEKISPFLSTSIMDSFSFDKLPEVVRILFEKVEDIPFFPRICAQLSVLTSDYLRPVSPENQAARVIKPETIFGL